MVDAALADPRGLTAQRTTVIEVAGQACRFGSIMEYADGSAPLEVLDVGEVDSDGRIAVLYALTGPLRAPRRGDAIRSGTCQ